MAAKTETPVSENPNLSVAKLGEEKVNNAKKQKIEIGELKSKIKELKKSPGDFNPRIWFLGGKTRKFLSYLFVPRLSRSRKRVEGF